jgi:hypothetical protein
VTPFSYTDPTNNTVAFSDGILSTVGPVTLTPNAASDLCAKLLQWNGVQRAVGHG